MTGGAVLFLLVLLIYLLEGVLPPLKQRAVKRTYPRQAELWFSV